jgi:hypothetical protein
VAVKDFLGIPKAGRKHCRIAQQLHAADAFQAADTNYFKGKTRLGYQARFHSSLGSNKDHLSFSWPAPESAAANPLFGDGKRRKYVPAGATARN